MKPDKYIETAAGSGLEPDDYRGVDEEGAGNKDEENTNGYTTVNRCQ